MHEADRSFVDLAENAGEGILVGAEDGTHVYANRAASEITGHSREELLGISIEQLVAPEEVERIKSNFRRRLAGEDIPNRYETLIVHKDGSHVPIEISASRTIWRGKPCVMVFLRDVSTAKRVEQELKESEERFRAIAENTPGVVYSYTVGPDLKRVKLYFGPGIAKLTGGSVPAATDGALDWFIDRIHPEDRQALEEAGVLDPATETPVDVEYRIRTDDGGYRWIRSIARAYPIEGGGSRWYGLFVDINARKQAEEALRESEARLQTAIESLPFGFWLRDENQHLIMQNSQSKALWGDLVGTSTEASNAAPETIAKWQSNNARAFAGEVVSEEVELVHSGGSGTFHNIIAPIHTAEGIRGILGINIDITERKRAADELLRLQRYESIGVVAGNIGHEVYNSLSPAATVLAKLRQLLQKNEPTDPERVLSLIDLAESAVQRAIRTTETIKHFSRHIRETGIEKLDLSKILGQVVSEAREVEGGGVTIDLDIPSGVQIQMNENQALSLFSNLLANSVRAMADVSDRRIGIVARSEVDSVLIEITDSGPGVDPAIIDRLFEPFVTTRPSSGTGLGLAICKRIVDVYGGQIWHDADRKDGTTFVVRLPVTRDATG